MALVVEDGTGKSTAESYISAADATTYHNNRGNAAWAALASDTVREQYLRKATDFMIQAYASRWQGCKVDASVQALDWPRYDVVVDDESIDDNVVPEVVKRACAELALKAISGDLMPDLSQGVLSEQVGSIKVDYDKTSSQLPRYPAIEAMLAPYFDENSSGCMMKMERS